MAETEVNMLLAKDVAARLKIPLARVYILIKSGKMPSIKIGRNVRVPEDWLEAWIRRGGTNGQTPQK